MKYDAFFADAQLRERTKHLSETDKYKLQAHRTLSKELIAEGVPQEFWTTSPVCIIRNVWDSQDHTTNAIESVNMSLRKITKNRGSFPSDDALLKLFFLALANISKKWTIPLRDWRAALTRFTIQLEERMPKP